MNDERLYSILNKISSEKYNKSISNNSGEILLASGLLYLSTYIDTEKQPTGLYYTKPSYLTEMTHLIISNLVKEDNLYKIFKEKKILKNVDIVMKIL